MRLTREIRFSVEPEPAGPVLNSWAGWPAATTIAPYLVLRATLDGEPHPVTGYICNIKVIDETLRQVAIPLARGHVGASPESYLARLRDGLATRAPTGTRWAGHELFATTCLRYEVTTAMPDLVQVTQSFEFSASHRLHCPSLSDDENRRIFGKCNNPTGHGHNYQLEVTVAGRIDAATQRLIDIRALERVVKERVVDRFDHKHLNTDCGEFKDLNPSVENIARVIWSLLEDRFAPAALHRVRVWETPKTCAEIVAA